MAALRVPIAPRTRVPSTSFVWIGPIFEPTGYADEGRGFLRALHRAGVPVSLRSRATEEAGYRDGMSAEDLTLFEAQRAAPIRPPFVLCQHSVASAFVPSPDAACNVGRTMFETDCLPPDWVARCNDLDEVWVPSRFNVESFRAAGVRAPLAVIPGGIDVERFRPEATPLHLAGTRGTVFLSVFEWRRRKGWDVLLRAWAEAFGPEADATLVLRTYPVGAPAGADRRAMLESAIDEFLLTACGRRRCEVAPIVVLTDLIPDAQLPSLYTAADVYVSPTRGEGWGRPFMEAMACGRPVIATRWSAHLEFMRDTNSLLLDIDGVEPVLDPEAPLYHGHRWAVPRTSHLVELLRHAHADRAHRLAMGAQARRDMVADWGWDRAAAAIAGRLAALGVVRAPQTTSGRPATAGARIVVDAELLVAHRAPLDLPSWVVPWGAQDDAVGLVPRESNPLRPPSHTPAAMLDAMVIAPPARREATLTWLRRADGAMPSRPLQGRWIVATGDAVTEAVPPSLLPIVTSADDVWVPHAAALEACRRAGVPDARLHALPRMRPSLDTRASDSVFARPLAAATVFGLVVGSDEQLPAADALVRTWERAFAAHPERRLFVICAHAPGDATFVWYHKLRDRAAMTPGIDVHAIRLVDDLWPAMLPALDVLVVPGAAPSVSGLLECAAAFGVPAIAAPGDPFVPAAGGWAVPMAATGRFEWPAFARAVSEAEDSAARAGRVETARRAAAALPGAEAMIAFARARLAAGGALVGAS